MNNDLKYSLQGFLLALSLFLFLKITFFLSSINIESPQEQHIENTVQVSSVTIKNTAGKTLFAQNCASCHAINKILTGPALAGVEDRVPNKKILYDWIRNNQKVLQSGNAYFNNLYKEYNKTPMNLFTNFSNEDIDNILAYIKEVSYQPAGLPSASLN